MAAKVKRPTRLKILNLTYKVKFMEATEHEVSDADGWCDHEHQTIAIYKHLSSESMADCFLHECIHAISHVMDISWRSEEQVARRLSTGLCTLWKANRAAFRWWSGLL